jgi:hypothetical protein
MSFKISTSKENYYYDIKEVRDLKTKTGRTMSVACIYSKNWVDGKNTYQYADVLIFENDIFLEVGDRIALLTPSITYKIYQGEIKGIQFLGQKEDFIIDSIREKNKQREQDKMKLVSKRTTKSEEIEEEVEEEIPPTIEESKGDETINVPF